MGDDGGLMPPKLDNGQDRQKDAAADQHSADQIGQSARQATGQSP